MRLHRRTALAALAAPLLPLPAAGQGTDWPNRPVTILVPFVAGGPSDIVARAIANRMSQSIGQPVVAENRPGANGEVAARQVVRAAPDGYTLFVGSIGVFAINTALRPNLGYDPIRELTPITLAVTTPNVLVVNPERVPVRTLAELVEWLRRNRGRTSYSTSGVGSSDHLTMELFKQRTGTDPEHVPYQGGAAAATDLIAGNVQLSFQNLGTVAGHIQGGRLRAIAVTSAERNRLLPEVPTAIEQGLADFVVTSWQAVMAPAGMTPPLLARVHGAVVEALRNAENVQRLNAIGFDVVANAPDEYRRFQEAEIARWRQVVQTANIRAE
ncbi:Bug family tripartite tricarboxylate transporter substrate binding protein [Falsiroseomonas oryziterrae]|uniref:Bug family tripartite tricarboxylate transporter substrate binding protein n=1 Tax=Falsiroseomonas oryziterrae TaxID=2911368 RepID=UPI001F23260A|nr:tripartite tricarboxylate transporter substrate binding protein [Roseomonas sp. NPKOSM-4]